MDHNSSTCSTFWGWLDCWILSSLGVGDYFLHLCVSCTQHRAWHIISTQGTFLEGISQCMSAWTTLSLHCLFLETGGWNFDLETPKVNVEQSNVWALLIYEESFCMFHNICIWLMDLRVLNYVGWWWSNEDQQVSNLPFLTAHFLSVYLYFITMKNRFHWRSSFLRMKIRRGEEQWEWRKKQAVTIGQ